MTASPGDGEQAPREGYYPDPSIPGYVRYWNGSAWVPGTSRPAAPGAESAAVAERLAARAAARVPDPRATAPAVLEETGPVFFDELPDGPRQTDGPAAAGSSGGGPLGVDPYRDGPSDAVPSDAGPADAVPSDGVPADAVPAARAEWAADAGQQSGFGGDRDRKVSWGESRPADAPAAPVALAKAPAPTTGSASGSGPASASGPAAVSGIGSDAASGSGTTSRSGIASGAGTGSPIGSGSGSGPAAASGTGGAAGARAAAAGSEEAVVPGQAAAAGILSVRSPAGSAPRPAAEPAAPAGPQAPAAAAAAPEAAASARSAGLPAASEDLFRQLAAPAPSRPAGLLRRGLARLLDSLVVAAVTAAVALPFVTKATDHVQDKIDAAKLTGETVTVYLVDGTTGGYLALVLGAFVVFGLLYEVLPVWLWGRTLGKAVFRVRVCGLESQRKPSFGAALGRWLVYGLLGLAGVGVLGGLWCLVDRPWRQGWHDKAAGTFVTR
ncbi:RDD family protein [Streptomyces sp. NPDC089919]|uniref:RDD family protein n=1 Tax=Streptomyces sp. NPDC089919 TaxID=3155188 RepID=UPI0034409754